MGGQDEPRFLPGPKHPGDTVVVPGDREDTFVGYVLRRRKDGYLFDQPLLKGDSESDARPQWVEDFKVVNRAARPTYNQYVISNDLKNAFGEFLNAYMWGLANQVIDDARHEGYQLYIAGGPVRDFILGRLQVNDLDMTGDMPPGLFRDLLTHSAMKLLPKSRDEYSEAWLPWVNISSSGVVHAYRLMRGRGPNAPVYEVNHFLEYAPLKERLHGDESGRFVYGWDARRDYHWRDMTINALLYDPARKVVLDPSPGSVIEDLGVTTRWLKGWSGSTVDEREIVLCPIDVPADAELYWTAKAVARFVKSAQKFPHARLTGIDDWIEKHEDKVRLVAPVSHEVERVGLQGYLAAALKIKPGPEMVRALQETGRRLAEAKAPDWFIENLEEAGRAPLSASTPPEHWPASAVGAVMLNPQGQAKDRFTLGRDLPGPSEAESGLFFGRLFSGWESRVVSIEEETVTALTNGQMFVAAVDGTGGVILGGSQRPHLRDNDSHRPEDRGDRPEASDGHVRTPRLAPGTPGVDGADLRPLHTAVFEAEHGWIRFNVDHEGLRGDEWDSTRLSAQGEPVAAGDGSTSNARTPAAVAGWPQAALLIREDHVAVLPPWAYVAVDAASLRASPEGDHLATLRDGRLTFHDLDFAGEARGTKPVGLETGGRLLATGRNGSAERARTALISWGAGKMGVGTPGGTVVVDEGAIPVRVSTDECIAGVIADGHVVMVDEKGAASHVDLGGRHDPVAVPWLAGVRVVDVDAVIVRGLVLVAALCEQDGAWNVRYAEFDDGGWGPIHFGDSIKEAQRLVLVRRPTGKLLLILVRDGAKNEVLEDELPDPTRRADAAEATPRAVPK